MDSVFHRYALALALVPDPDAAGDLFMDAVNEAALRRAAARWRRRHGLPDLAADPPLPELTAEQQEDALHLLRRGRVRRRLRRMVAAAGLLLLLTGVAVLPTRPAGLAADPVFTDQPAHMSELRSGGRLGIYRVEAAPGSVTVWWELIGGSAGGSQMPQLMLSGSDGPWLEPAQHEMTRARGGRTLGRSVFQVVTWPHQGAILRIGELQVTAPMANVEQEEGARSILVRRSVSQEGYLFTVDEVVAGPTHTILRYRVTALAQNELRHLVRVAADDHGEVWLQPLAPPQVDGSAVEVILAPVPEGATALGVWFHTPGSEIHTPPQADELISLSRSGETVAAKLRFSSYGWNRRMFMFTPLPLAEWPWSLETTYMTDSAGRRYEALPIYEGKDLSRHQYLWRIEANVPESISLDQLQLHIARVGFTPGLRLLIRL